MDGQRRILVAVDGSADSARAMDWAVAEARHRQLPLVAVHAAPHLLQLDDEPAIADQRERVDEVLRTARQQAAHVPAVELSVLRLEPTGFEVAPTIVGAVEPEDLLVVGARGHGKVTGLLLGSVSQYAVRHARGTVVVVRHQQDDAARRTVVGFDGTEGADRALDWALDRAAHSGAPVTVLHAWHAPTLQGAATVRPLPGDAVRVQDDAAAVLEADLAPWRDKYPTVRLRAEAVPGHARQLLTVASRHAALVVVGSRRRGPVAGTVLGSVGQAVLRHAHCPVAVVR